MEIRKLLRPHLLDLTPYSSARDEFKGSADVYLDANENSFGSTSKDRYRRYPDPYQHKLKQKIGQIKIYASLKKGNLGVYLQPAVSQEWHAYKDNHCQNLENQ